MAEISFTGNKLLKSINKEWCTKFPYLYLSFINTEGKAVGDWNNSHASVRATKGADELNTTATMNVSTFERRYKDAYGVEVEIKYVKNGRKYRSLGEHNNMTLSEFNKWVKDNGGSEIMTTHPEWFK
jgi:hypothetical protein